MIGTERKKEAIKKALRIPDCEHNHISYPDADIQTILTSLKREGYSIVSTALLSYIEDALLASARAGDMAEIRLLALQREQVENLFLLVNKD